MLPSASHAPVKRGADVIKEDAMRPNILFIMADQFCADALGCMGAPVKTPHLDALAREGVLFTNCYT